MRKKTEQKTGKKEISLFMSKLQKYDLEKEHARRKEEAKKSIVFGMPAVGNRPDELLIIDRTDRRCETIIKIAIGDIEGITELPAIMDPLTFKSIRQVQVKMRPGACPDALLHGYDMEPALEHIQLMQPELAKTTRPRAREIAEGCPSCSCGDTSYGQRISGGLSHQKKAHAYCD